MIAPLLSKIGIRRDRKDPPRVDACSSGPSGLMWCNGLTSRHGSCSECGAVTCKKRVRIERQTLRRQLRFLCSDCYDPFCHTEPDHDLRRKRVHRDFAQVTSPVNVKAIHPDQMADYEGVSRQAIRAFLATESEVATVPNVAAQAIQETIYTLGLEREIFAEQRASTTVLRRVSKKEAS